MAKYNQRLNEQIYESAQGLPESKINENLGAFFGSILGTLNHILVGDILWLSRYKTHSCEYKSLLKIDDYPTPNGLNDILYKDVKELYRARKEIDELLINWIDEISESDLERQFLYKNAQGVTSSRNFAEVLSHLFNHQTHHRGQVSTLLSQFGVDIGVTDFIVDVPNSQA